MASGVVKVGRRTYAVGLFWQPSPSGRVAQAAREAGRQPGQKADYYCVRPATKTVAIPQYGLGQTTLGHSAGMPTLASSLANAQPGSWVGAFRLREGTWVIVVRDDLVAPDGDFLFDNDELARERLLQEVGLGGMQRIYAPDGWSIPGSDPTPLPLLLQDRADCPLQPIQVPVKLLMYGAGGIALIAAIVVLALQWQAEQEQQELAAQQAAAAAQSQQQTPSGPISSLVEDWKWPPAEEVYEKVWENRPRFRDAVLQCKELFVQPRVVQLGWERGTVSCAGGTLSIDLKRVATKGNNPAVVPDTAQPSETLLTTSQSYSLPALPNRGVEQLAGVQEINKLSLNRGTPGDFTRLPDDMPKIQPPENVKDPPPPPPPLWIKRSFKYSGSVQPWAMFYYFDNIPGLILEKITWNGSTWELEATIYEMRGGS